MKILIVASWFPTLAVPVSGIFVAEQAAALATRHEVTVLAPEVVGPASSWTLRVESAGTYRVIRAGIPTGNYVHALRYVSRVTHEIRLGAYDVIHAHVTLPGGFAAVLAGLLTRRPSVITEHMRPFKNLMASKRDRAKTRFALNHASAVIAVSHGLKTQMQAQGITRPILIVPNLIDTRKFIHSPQRARTPGQFNLIFVGRLNDKQKNLPALLKAMSRLGNTDGSQYHLRIIGDGKLRCEYEQQAKDLGVYPRYKFEGFLRPEEIAQALAASDVLVLPSFYENCPVVVAEALAVGRPAIVTRCGGSEEMITPECGSVVPVDDPAALSQAIIDLCHNLDSYPSDKISAYAHSRFGEAVVVNRLTEIYESIMPDSAKRRQAIRMRVA